MRLNESVRIMSFCALASIGLYAQQNATVETIAAVLNASVSSGANRDFALCELRAAVWGGYNARVFMPRSSTTGNQALIFRITDGVLLQEVNPSPSGSTGASAIKEGRVDLANREAAFARGLPFHVGNVSFASPLSIQFTVYSNPAASVPRVFGRFESVSSLTNLQIVDTPNPFGSSAQPQPRTFTLNTPLNQDRESYLSAVTSASGLNCLMSNEVDLLAASVTTPRIRPRLPVLQSFNGAQRASPGTWIQIFGERLATTTREWSLADFQGPQAPTSLDGVRVNVNGKPAFVRFVSPNQVNVQTPDDESNGDVAIELINAAGTSNRVTVAHGPASPALLTTPAFLIGGKQYVAALFPDFTTFAGRNNLIPGVPFRPAKPGDTIIVFAVGCGATVPPAPAGQVLAATLPLAQNVSVRLGDVPAEARAFAAGQAIGLCQFNIVVPEIADGDHRLAASVGGVDTGQALFLTVQR